MENKKKENPKTSQPEIRPVVAKPAGPEEGTRTIIKMAKKKSEHDGNG